MTEPLLSSFIYEGRTIQVEWYDIPSGSKVPDLPWQQVYAIGNLGGKVPVVFYEDGRRNLPGGTVEQGESVAETVARELQEEINCKVLTWKTIGYQKLTTPSKAEPVYQLRIYAKLEKIGEFENDPGGNVIGYELVELRNLNTAIRYGNVGERMVELVASEF